MGRMIHISLNPPDPKPGVMTCPSCGAQLYYNDIYYVLPEHGYRKIIACQNCIDELAEFVEEE